MIVHRLAHHARLTGLLLVMALLACGLASASETYTPPAAQAQTWKGVITAGAVRAQVLLRCDHAGAGDTASFAVTGLKPNGVYSFWLIGANGSARGLGRAPYHARANAGGSLTYKPALGFCPSGSRLTIQVNHHPSPGKTAKVLKGSVAQQ